MQVRETTLQELVGGAKQFRVPMFQRTYTWAEKDHAHLWRDIMAQYDLLVSDPGKGSAASPAGHFIGSFVLAPSPGTATLPVFLVVDGQQRLTTLTIALCAVRDAAAVADSESFDRITNQYLVNQYAKDHHRLKLVPTEQDKKAYTSFIQGHDPGGKDLIARAYRFFKARLAELGPDDDPLDLALVEAVIVSHLSIVDITAQAGDNVHRIFESLNATGVGLTQGDLLRNYFFMLLPTRAKQVYDEVWLPMQELIGVDNLEGLARVDLRRRGVDVRDDDVYRSQQARLLSKEADESAMEAEIRDLALRAEHYASILSPEREKNPEIAKRLAFLKRWRATTAHPLIMLLFERRADGSLSDEDVAVALHNIEGFLVRRLLVGVSAKNLNRIFVQVVAAMRQKPDEPTIDEMRFQLSGERKFWATDKEVHAAVISRPFYYYGRAEQRRMVLERLEESFGHKEQGDLEQLKLSVEHIMPQHLSTEWRQMLEKADDDPDEVHRELVHTLGNLTLTAYNPELSDSPFERKKQIYEESHLSLNKELTENATWTRAQIQERAEALAKKIVDLWPAPMPGVSDAPSAFDWSRARAAIASIPEGRWTAYVDIAGLAGTAAQAVGNHIANNPTLPNAWRVLKAEGKVSDGFRWPDPTDERDPYDVLRGEGVVFDSDGRATPSQRLTVEDLNELIEWFDPEED